MGGDNELIVADLTVRQVRLNSCDVGLINQHHFCQMSFALGALGRHQMPTGGLRTQNFAASGDLESFRDGFPGLASSDGLRHRARKIEKVRRLTTGFHTGCA
jgi:hypothetical protein